ncbi:MAG: winged helix-turn-helix domain-containing protein [Chitinophagales bacterium]|nr:winged helix-turn-helix domain-containing protein [Chitinophagales bacterium]
MVEKISNQMARQIVLQSQLLDHPFPLSGKESVLKTIEHLSYIQIDTISVVERAHHHILWSRVADYKKSWLDQLQKEKLVFEYWSHAASYLPMKDYRFSLMRKRAYLRGKSHWFEQDKMLKKLVLLRIKNEGPLQSKDFEASVQGPREWYYWKPSKRALEQLFMEGKLMVSHRQGFQKVYDLTERVLPVETDLKFPSKNEYAEYLISSAIRANGIVTEREITYLRPGWKTEVGKAIRRLLKQNIITKVIVENNDSSIFFKSMQHQIDVSGAFKNSIHILSPFDNLLIQRKRTQQLFQFEYIIECYVPENKRKYGYFILPVIYEDKFIARLDAKADRDDEILLIRNLLFEDTESLTDEMLFSLAEKLKLFAVFNGCNNILVGKCNNKKGEAGVKKYLK